MLQIKNTLGGGKPNAPYAWAKYEYEVIPPIDAVNPTFEMSSSNYTVTITESTVDLTLIGDNWREFFDGFKYNSGDYPKFQNDSDLLRIYASSSTASRVTAFTATSPTTGTLTLQDSWSKSSTLCKFIGTKHIKDEESKVGSFIDYIVSDKETAFPDGGEKGGDWYERVVEGAKVVTGSITLSSSSNTLNIEHGLGKAPTKFAVILSSGTEIYRSGTISALYDGTNCYLNWHGEVLSSYEVMGGTGTPIISDTNISIPYYRSNWVAATYQWIAVAE